MFELTGKSAVITGGASGIGKAVSLLFARQGADVHVVDISGENVGQTVDEINSTGGRGQGHVCDVSIQQQVVDTYHKIRAVNILVNSAGVSHIGTVETTSEADFDRIFRVNVKGVYNSLYAAVPMMKRQGGGVILNMASVAAVVGIDERFAYSASKGAVYTMTMSIAKDFISDNIRCNCVSPGRVHTPFVDNYLARNYPGREKEMFDKLSKTQPIGRMATPNEIAQLILYLCSDEAGFVTGSDYPIDGGFIRLNS